jgi:hypothetical protein
MFHNEEILDWVKECTNKGMDELESECKWRSKNEWIRGWVSEYEWIKEWMSYRRVSEWEWEWGIEELVLGRERIPEEGGELPWLLGGLPWGEKGMDWR